MKEGGKTQQI